MKENKVLRLLLDEGDTGSVFHAVKWCVWIIAFAFFTGSIDEDSGQIFAVFAFIFSFFRFSEVEGGVFSSFTFLVPRLMACLIVVLKTYQVDMEFTSLSGFGLCASYLIWGALSMMLLTELAEDIKRASGGDDEGSANKMN
jgi:hypothetical protein